MFKGKQDEKFTNKKSTLTSINDNAFKPNQDALAYLYDVASKLLSISNHSLVCSHCINDDYLTKYLLEGANANNETFEGVTIKDAEKLEDKLIARFNEIKTIGKRLSNKDTSKEEYYQNAHKMNYMMMAKF